MSRILLVDDEADVRASLSAALAAMGHEVTEASGGHAGCLLAQQELFDCAVVDILMPDVDGLETIQLLRTVRPELPVIVMAGEGCLNQSLACRLALAMGADHALRKPIDLQALGVILDASGCPAVPRVAVRPARVL